jgi:hypothetical protein
MFAKKASILLIAGAALSLPLMASAQGKGGVTSTAAGKGGVVSSETLITRYGALAGSWSLNNSNPAGNATSLVNGVRSGGTISLYGPMLELELPPAPPPTTPPPPPPSCVPTPLKPCPPTTLKSTTPTAPKTTTTVQPKIVYKTISFDSPIGGTGYGNVDTALALAEADATKNKQLKLPLTPEQLKAALLGGTVRTAPGAPSTVTFTGILALREKGNGWGEVAKALNLELVDAK